jgi:hypothetical protein
MRLLVEEILVSGWNVSIRLRIPLDEPRPEPPGRTATPGERPVGGVSSKDVCDLLVETEGESYRLQDAKARTRQTRRDAVSSAARFGANDKLAGLWTRLPSASNF